MPELETLARVADVYVRALSDGRPPTAAVAEHFLRPHSTAAKWVMHARAKGLIPPVVRKGGAALGGWVGTRNHKAVAIAAELGVAYDDLVNAVRKHAGGDLRL